MARKSPTSSALRRLYTLSGNQCAFPDCTHALVSSEGIGIAQICHIEAAEKGGQRYNENQTDEDRRAFDNLIILCHAHHKITDDVLKYSVSDLKLIKSNHEQRFLENAYEIEDSVLDRIKDALDEKLDHIFNQNIHTHQALAELKFDVASINLGQTNILSTNDNSLYNELLKIGISLRKDNNFSAALSSFLKFEEERWNELTDELRFKLLANIGVTFLDMGRNQEGAAYFLKINLLEDETLYGLAYICLAYAILKQEEKFDFYFNKAILLGKQNTNLWLAYLFIKGGKVAASTLQNDIPASLLKDESILIKLLELYNAEGKIDEVKESFWKIEAIVEDDSYKNWQIINSYTGLIVSSILRVDKIQFKTFTEMELQSIEKARHLYSRIITILENGSADKMLSIAYYNRSLCFKALAKEAEAERDFEKSWSISPRFFSFKGLFLYHLDNNRLQRCELLLEEWKQKQINAGDDERFETLACEARLWAKQGDKLRLESTLLEAYCNMPIEYKPLILDNFVLNGVLLKDYDLVKVYSESLVSEFSDYVYGYIGLFAYHMEQGNLSNAKNVLKQAKDKKYDKRSEAFIWMQLADGFCELNEYREALVYFEKLKEHNSLNEMTPRYAECLYHLEKYMHVIDLLREKDFSCLDLTTQQILFLSYYKLDFIEEAEIVLKQGLILIDSRSVNLFRKLGAVFYSENDQFQEAASLILAIDDFSKFGIMEALDLSGLLSSMGYVRDAFDLAYKLRVLNYETYEAQKYYMDLALHHGNFFKTNELFLKKVEENTLVVLKDINNREYKYYLTGDNMISDAVLLEAGNQLWNVLVGTTKGQKVILPNTMGDFEVAEIWSKRLIAFRDSLFLLQNKYADKAGMYFGKLG